MSNEAEEAQRIDDERRFALLIGGGERDDLVRVFPELQDPALQAYWNVFGSREAISTQRRPVDPVDPVSGDSGARRIGGELITLTYSAWDRDRLTTFSAEALSGARRVFRNVARSEIDGVHDDGQGIVELMAGRHVSGPAREGVVRVRNGPETDEAPAANIWLPGAGSVVPPSAAAIFSVAKPK